MLSSMYAYCQFESLTFFFSSFRSKSWLLPASDLLSVWNSSLPVNALPLKRLWLTWIFELCYFNLTIKLRDWAVYHPLVYAKVLSHLLSSRGFSVSSCSTMMSSATQLSVLLIWALWIENWGGKSCLSFNSVNLIMFILVELARLKGFMKKRCKTTIWSRKENCTTTSWILLKML